LKREIEITRNKLQISALETLDGYLTSQRNMEYAYQQLAAAQERVRENLLRFAYLPGDVIEKVQQSRLDAYKAALDIIDVQIKKLNQQAILLNFAPKASNNPSNANSTTDDRYLSSADITSDLLCLSPIKSQSSNYQGMAVYMWRTENLPYEADQQQKFFNDLEHQNIRRLLVSFTAEQIAALEKDSDKLRLTTFIQNAHEYGLKVELLLGEPLWILPQFRPRLMTLIEELSVVPFDGVHLDLEPDQLPPENNDTPQVLDQLCSTIEAVKSVSRLPVGLSIHYRYLQSDESVGCLGCRFEKLGLDEITLMIYISDSKRVLEIAQSILTRFPRLKFSIAQSVEPILTTSESYFSQSRASFLTQMDTLRSKIDHNNFVSIFIQDWQALSEMKP
jgi:hypothetical protein